MSSIVITAFVLFIELVIVSSSNGFRNLAFITSALIPFCSRIFATSIALATIFPIAIIDISSPFFIISAFPCCISFDSSNLILASPPLGYLIKIGFSALTAYSIIFSNSLKSFGANISKFGTILKKDKSYIP